MNVSESVMLAIDSVRSSKLRTSLTLLSIAIGVFALMGAASMVSSIDNTVANEMSSLGEHTFMIKRIPSLQMGNNAWRKYRARKDITYAQLKELKSYTGYGDRISAFTSDEANVIKSKYIDSDPDVTILGADQNYFINNNISISEGRQITESDLESKANVVLIGNDVRVKIFPFGNPIGEMIRIKNKEFEIIGILEPKGAILGRSQDNNVIVPLTNFLQNFANQRRQSLDISIRAESYIEMQNMIDETIGAMRAIRNVQPWEDNSFEIETNEIITQQFSGFTSYISLFGYIVGFFSLIAAGVGIMNIMLVAVKERTREIGIRKAVGAKRKWIMFQFLIETITLCQIGGLIGMGMGVGAAFLFGAFLGLSISIPIFWVITSIAICTAMGLSFGLYPAWQAANLDPIEALRYE